jgi:hypothetical protein
MFILFIYQILKPLLIASLSRNRTFLPLFPSTISLTAYRYNHIN